MHPGHVSTLSPPTHTLLSSHDQYLPSPLPSPSLTPSLQGEVEVAYRITVAARDGKVWGL